jgi:3-deoxy-D-manno-octulosonic-acid transferase
MSKFFYNVFLLVYNVAAYILCPWMPKARKWVNGRKNWREKISQQWAVARPPTANRQLPTVVWMHCASLGEFEQGRPVLESLRQKNPGHKIIVSFFSPSGYEIGKDYAGADMVCYLPMDSETNAKDFLDIIQPSLVLWVKYEYWFYFLQEINNRKIPLLLISGIFRPGQAFFKCYGDLHRQMIVFFSHLFVQNQGSYDLIAPLVGKEKITVAGDTRFDRVIEIAENFKPIPEIEQWLNGADKVFVAGSTWPEDEEELTHYVKNHPEIKFIIAPHNIDEENIADAMELFPMAVKWSVANGQWSVGESANVRRETSDVNKIMPLRKLEESIESNPLTTYHSPLTHVLLIDTIGLLSKLYHYATVTFVGGGFGDDGVHNVLEAAVYGKPVIHGPEFEKYPEAVGLVEAGGAYNVEDALELESILERLFSDKPFYDEASQAAKTFVYKQQGATKQVMDYIKQTVFPPIA